MGTRVGIELSPAACRVIEIETGTPWNRRSRRATETRVQAFAVFEPSGPEVRAKFEALRGQSAAVVVWGVPSDHRQVIVANRSYETMRREALAALGSVGIETRGVLADIAPATPKDRAARRPVVVALAAAVPMSEAIAPLENAGIRVRAVMTPAGALTSLARSRIEFAVPGSIEAYVALDETATCIALVRNGALITARELSWGYLNDVGPAQPRGHDDIALRLTDQLSEFFAAVDASPAAVGQVCVCGGLPELRSMAVRLTARLDIEVEALDSLHGIDPELLYEHADEFRDFAAELRVAWAAAADWPPAINLLRARKRRATRRAVSRAAIAAGAVVGLGIGWQVQRSAWWRSRVPALITRTASNERPTGPPSAPAGRAATPAAKAPAPSAAAPPPVTATRPPAPPAAPPPSAQATRPPAASVAPPAAATKPATPTIAPPPSAQATKPPAASVTPPTAATKPATSTALTPPPSPQATRPPAASVTPPAAATKPATPTIAPPPSAQATRPPAAPAAPPAAATKPVAPPAARVEAPPPISVPPLTLPRPSASTPATRREPERTPPPRVETPPAPRPAPVQVPPSVPPRAQTAPPPSAAVPTRQNEPPLESPPLDVPRREAPVRAARQEVALAFEAALGTILYSPDRKLAIIDGRIVGVGDEVRGARVIDITPTAVFLRDAQGRLRRLALAAGR